MKVVTGVDVSVMQGVVPFDLLKQAGHEFAFIRCKVGNNPGVDTRFVENVKRARGEGIFTSPYFFPFPLPHLDPLEQAKGFFDAAMVDGDPVGSMRGDLPVAYDLEWPPPEQWGKYGCTADQIVDFACAQLERLDADYGSSPIVYSYPYELQALSKAKNFSQLTRRRLWIAGGPQYVNGNGQTPRRDDEGNWLDKAPNAVGWGDAWLFWQHDGDGGKKLPNGVDCDFDVFRFDTTALGQLAQIIDGDPPILVPDAATIRVIASGVMVDDGVHAHRQERLEAIFANA